MTIAWHIIAWLGRVTMLTQLYAGARLRRCHCGLRQRRGRSICSNPLAQRPNTTWINANFGHPRPDPDADTLAKILGRGDAP